MDGVTFPEQPKRDLHFRSCTYEILAILDEAAELKGLVGGPIAGVMANARNESCCALDTTALPYST